MALDLSSEMRVRFADAGIPAITGRNDHVVGFVGVTERGPLNVATLVSSWAEYKRIFGGFTTSADVATAVWNYFNEVGNGSKTVYVVRVVHYTDITDATTYASAPATVTLQTAAIGTTTYDTLRVDGKTHGTYAHTIKIRIEAATDGVADHFNLKVENSGVVVETWANLSMDDSDARYAETIINDDSTGSDYITVTDLDAGVSAANQRPASGLSGFMATGNDGLTSLADTDYTGDSAAKLGLYALDIVERLSLLVVPGRATSTVQNAMITYCGTTRNGQCFAILDPPASNAKAAVVTYVKTTAALKNLSQKGAMYWPRVRIANPNQTVFGTADSLTVPPSGHIAGVFARAAGEGKKGKFTTPAGQDWALRTVIGFEGEDDDRLQPHEVTLKDTRDFVVPERINPIRKDRNSPFYIDGHYTLKTGNGRDFPNVGEQVGAQYVAQSVEEALDVVRHRDNDDVTREECRCVVDDFLKSLTERGCFISRDPALAYVVDFGTGLNTPAVIAEGKLKGYVGIATNTPIQWGEIEISKDTRAYDASASA